MPDQLLQRIEEEGLIIEVHMHTPKKKGKDSIHIVISQIVPKQWQVTMANTSKYQGKIRLERDSQA